MKRSWCLLEEVMFSRNQREILYTPNTMTLTGLDDMMTSAFRLGLFAIFWNPQTMNVTTDHIASFLRLPYSGKWKGFVQISLYCHLVYGLNSEPMMTRKSVLWSFILYVTPLIVTKNSVIVLLTMWEVSDWTCVSYWVTFYWFIYYFIHLLFRLWVWDWEVGKRRTGDNS